jgi:hypothetical protein
MFALVGLGMLAGSVPAFAYTPFDCAAARIRGRASGGPVREYYARLFEQCGCEPGSKIALCEWLKQQEHGWHRHRRHRPDH